MLSSTEEHIESFEPNAKDNELFLQLFVKAQPALRRYIYSQVPNFHETEDLLQQVSIALWNKFDQYDPNGTFEGWAIRMALYEILNHRRKYARNKVVLSETILEKAAKIYEDKSSDEISEEQFALNDCMSSLPEDKHKLMKLYYYDQKSCIKIAEIVKRKANIVRVLIHRIREVIRKCVDKKINNSMELV